MSPEELRKRLKDYGISTGPITPTTFMVYVRKLKSLRTRNSQVNRQSRHAFASQSSSSTVASAASLNGFSSDESDAENEGRRDRLSMFDNYDAISDYGRARRNHMWDVTQSPDRIRDTAQPDGNHEMNLSAYEQFSLVRPSIRTYNHHDFANTNRYGIAKSPVQTWNRQPPFLGVGNSSVVGSSKAAASGFNESRHSWQLISRIIVLLVLFFVVVVVVSYCFITRSAQLPVDTRSDYILCSGEVPRGTSSPPMCTSQLELVIIRELLDALSIRAGDYDCGYQSDTRSMRRAEIIQLLDDSVLITAGRKSEEYLPLIAEMCFRNDHWGITVYGHTKDKDFALESLVGKKSLWCRVKDSARYIFSIVVLAFLVVGAGCSLFVYVRLRRTASEAERREVFDLVEKIIDILRQNAAAAEAAAVDQQERPVPPYLAIPHVRDALIPLHLRRAKQHIWDQAVKFLSAHESRVRVEHQQISGEG